MRLLEFLNTVNLFEAAKDRYAEMFQNLIPLFTELGEGDSFTNEVNEEIKWAMENLKRQDRIIWFLRFVKLQILVRTAQSSTDPEQKEVLDRAATKFAGQIAKKMGLETHQAIQAAEGATSNRYRQNLLHFLSLGVAGIDEYVFTNQAPGQIIQDWTPIEDAWKAKRSALVDMDREGVETLIEYPDGSEWVNINRGYCRQEADAMGHCGNASPGENDTILSYRTIEEVEGKKMWKPRLTFILDTRTGLLGETKGRGNDKPSEKYHNVIVDLLRLPIIKGIRGGGYLPENNFMLSDLPQEVQDELVEEKPGLASLSYDFKKRGMTKQLLDRMEATWEETDMSFPEFKNNMFWYDTRYDLDDFLESYGGDQAVWAAKILDGREHLDIWFDGGYYDSDIFDSLPTKVQHQVGAWLIENYPDAVEEWKEENDTDYDGTDTTATMKIVGENGIDEITEALHRAEMTGHEYGVEQAMQEDLAAWLKELPNEMDWDLTVDPDTTYEDDDKEYRKIGMDPELFIDILDNHLDDVENEGGIPEIAGIKKLEAPYNGWEGYDEEGARDRAIEELYEAGVLER